MSAGCGVHPKADSNSLHLKRLSLFFTFSQNTSRLQRETCPWRAYTSSQCLLMLETFTGCVLFEVAVHMRRDARFKSLFWQRLRKIGNCRAPCLIWAPEDTAGHPETEPCEGKFTVGWWDAARSGGREAYSKPASTHIKKAEYLLSILGVQAARVGEALVLLCWRAAEVNPHFCGFVHQNKTSKIKTRDRDNFLTHLESLNDIWFFFRMSMVESKKPKPPFVVGATHAACKSNIFRLAEINPRVITFTLVGVLRFDGCFRSRRACCCGG